MEQGEVVGLGDVVEDAVGMYVFKCVAHRDIHQPTLDEVYIINVYVRYLSIPFSATFWVTAAAAALVVEEDEEGAVA